MPLLIRELNIKVSVGKTAGGAGAASGASGGAGGRDGKSSDAATVKRAVEEMLRIEAARKER
jgi:hypothetical protein